MSSISPLTVKGGVVRVIDDATGDIARTSQGFIENEKYAIYAQPGAGTFSAEFDGAVTRTGRLTVKLTTTNAAGRCRFLQNGNLDSGVASTESIVKKYGVPIVEGKSYRLSCYVKTDSVASNSVYLDFGAWTSGGVIVTVTGSTTNKLTGTNDWTLLTSTFTAPATSAYGAVRGLINVAGDAQQAWFDVNSMTLEEVTSITNSSSTPALFYPIATAVTSTDNIDQNALNDSAAASFGTLANNRTAFRFTPTKKNLTSVVFRRKANIGSFTGDVTVSIQADSAGVPSGTALASSTISNATWNAITVDTDSSVSLPLTLTAGVQYWAVFQVSTAPSDTNYPQLSRHTSGSNRFNYNGTTWSAASNDLYFKTLYSKNTTNLTVSTDTQTVSVTAPTVDGWANGTVVNFSDPLTLASGANAIYVSSNGPSTADGTVDPSLQATMGGEVYGKMYTNQTLLNLINGTVGLSQTACLNSLAGTTGLSRQQAMNAWASTTGLRIQDAVNIKAGTTGLNIQDALYVIAGL